MAEYIKREDAIDILNEFIEEAGNRGDTEVEGTCMMARNEIIDLPSIDIKTGEWIDRCGEDEDYECSECGGITEKFGGRYLYDYCPFCGAKMGSDKEQEE